MLGFMRRKNELKASINKTVNKDFMEALIAGSIWIASNDGELEIEELDRIEAICQTNDRLANFGSEISALIAKYKEKFERVGAAVIRFDAKRELADIKHDPEQAAEVFVNLIAIAQADGEIEPSELKALEEIGRMFGLRVEDFA